MQTSQRAVGGRVTCVVLVALTLSPKPGVAAQCEARTMRVSFYTCGEGFSHCLTQAGHQPIPFRTVAVGDRSLLGRWLYVEDLGGWVLASDTGKALKKNSIDVFIGEGRMARHARRLGVQFWLVRVCAPGETVEPEPGLPDVLREARAVASAPPELRLQPAASAANR